MPLLARQSPQEPGTEALVRPRLPPVQRSIGDESMDVHQEVEDREMIYQEQIRPPLTILNPREDSPLPPDMESQKQEQPALSSNVPLIKEPSGDFQSAAKSPSKPDQQTFSLVPAKRSLEVDLDSMHENSLGESKQVLAPLTEPASKRLREEDGIYIPPVTEDDLPPPVATDLVEDHHSRSADLSASSRPSPSLRAAKEDMDDDSSDDSSIPPMDLTLATTDEDDDEDDDK
ncbi:MAG: hypothetical protein L6R42_005255 [Xanthoria sp. 1 TBL-2021]|nr:MAG: hypothetical protein L6R42_005255 [Xanthoria sp. 1 TBL-2021]